jgi:hypothetical protein
MGAVTGTVTDGRQGDVGYIKVVTDATVDDGDTIAVDLTDYGATGIDFILGWIHSTTDSILVQEQPTTAVSSGNVNSAIIRLNAASAAGNAGEKEGYITGVAKAAADDTVTITNANEILFAIAIDVATGVVDDTTISTNVLTLAGAATGTVNIRIIYK